MVDAEAGVGRVGAVAAGQQIVARAAVQAVTAVTAVEPVVTRATPQGVGPVLAGQEVVAGSRPRRNRKAGSRTGGRRGAVMPGRAPTANAAGKSRREITKGTCRTGESRQVAVQATIKVDWRGYAVHEG